MPQLDFMIVDTVDQAIKASEFLKAKKAGRMTFIIKDYIQSLQINEKESFQVPPNTKRIFDLIKVNSQQPIIPKILFWSIGNTLVTENISTAIKVAFQDEKNRKRVITMKGELVELSGTITSFGKR